MNKTAHEAPLHRHIKTTLHHDRPLEERVRLLRGRRRGRGKQEGEPIGSGEQVMGGAEASPGEQPVSEPAGEEGL